MLTGLVMWFMKTPVDHDHLEVIDHPPSKKLRAIKGHLDPYITSKDLEPYIVTLKDDEQLAILGTRTFKSHRKGDAHNRREAKASEQEAKAS
jgi:hypothetical protein